MLYASVICVYMPGYHKKTGVGIDSSVWTRHDGKAYIINPTFY